MNLNKPHQILPIKNVGCFLFLIFIATFRPAAIWPDFTMSLEPIAVLSIGLLLFYKILTTIGFLAFWQKFNVVLLLLAAYCSVCVLSLYLNLHRYADSHEVIRYGVTFIVISMSFPATILLFSLPQSERGLSLSRFKFSAYLPWVYFALLALMILWQFIDFESSKVLGQYFISAEIWPNRDVNGFFKVSSDLALILASLTILFLSHAGKSTERIGQVLFLVVAILFFISGLVIGSRTFFVLATLFVLKLLWSANIAGKHKALLILVGFVAVHLLVMFSGISTLGKFQLSLPYLGPLYFGVPFTSSDFSFQFNLITSGRSDIWLSAIELIKDNVLFGTSNGGFRLSHPDLKNTHNVFLQVLIDTGLVGASILLGLCYHLRRKLLDIFVVLLIVSLLTDFQLDHSLPYIICVGFLFSFQKNMGLISTFERPLSYVAKGNFLLYTLCIQLLILAVIYTQRNNDRLEETLNVRLINQVWSRSFDAEPIVIDSSTIEFLDYRNVSGLYWYTINKLSDDLPLCRYQYLTDLYHHDVSGNWFEMVDSQCDQISGDLSILSDANVWVTNLTYLKESDEFHVFRKAKFYSPLISIEQAGFNFEFTARADKSAKQPASIKVEIISGGSVIEAKEISVGSANYQNYSLAFDIEANIIAHFVISIVGPNNDMGHREHQGVWLKSTAITVE